jgi:hypothetical protein
MDGDQSIGGRPDSTDTLTAIAVPTLVLSGIEDQVTGPDEGRALAAAIRDARFMQVERAGHLANLEQPEVVNEALLDLLALMDLSPGRVPARVPPVVGRVSRQVGHQQGEVGGLGAGEGR